MAPVVIPATLQIRLIWTLSGVEWAENVLHALIGAGPAVDQGMADAVATHAGNAHTSSGLAAIQPTGVVLERASIRDIRTANQPLIESDITSAGTGTGELLPRGNALVVTLRTALAGRSFRGRVYVPGFDETTNDGAGRATAAAQAAAAAFIGDLNANLTGSGWPLAVASRLRSESNTVTAAITRNGIWDGQRSRAFNGI